MRQYWQKFAGRIDALSLRERVIIFLMVALVLITLLNSLVLDAQFARQKELSQRIAQEQSQMAGIQAQIQERLAALSVDPDAETKRRLQAIRQQNDAMQASLRSVQKELISPDKMGELLEGILRRNGGLRLLALKKLPAASLLEVAEAEQAAQPGSAPAAPAARPKTTPADAVFRHGVELTVQGSYADMVAYLADLQAMPWQLFWGAARLNADEYAKATLTLTVFTLSLDKAWLNL